MKEYLNPLKGGGYELSSDALCGDSIEVPDGAQLLSTDGDGNGLFFWEDGVNFVIDMNSQLVKGYESFSMFQSEYPRCKVLWQRPTQPEPLTFIDDEPQSLNDQYAEIEQVRQDVINNPNHYTSGGIECLDAMQAMLGRDEFIGFLRGNVFKYNWRYQLKNGVEDLKKAQFYQNKLIELESIY